MVLCGDPRQLGPAVRSGDCQAHGLAKSLLEGWAAQYGSEADSWQQQGRAPPMCEPVLPAPKHAGGTQCCTKQDSSWPRAGQPRADRAQQQGKALPHCEPGLQVEPQAASEPPAGRGFLLLKSFHAAGKSTLLHVSEPGPGAQCRPEALFC